MAQPTVLQCAGIQGVATAQTSSGTTLSVATTFGPSGGGQSEQYGSDTNASASSVIILAACGFTYGGTTYAITDPTGWTPIWKHSVTGSDGFNVGWVALYWTTGFTSNTQTITATVGPTNSYCNINGSMIEIGGASTTAPVDPNSGARADQNYTTTGFLNGPNLAASVANSLLLSFFSANDDYTAIGGSGNVPSGWTELFDSSSVGSNANLEAQRYNSIPTVGTAVQSSIGIGYVDYSPVTLSSYELFILPPSVAGQIPYNPQSRRQPLLAS
jgi:hypothetical protein